MENFVKAAGGIIYDNGQEDKGSCQILLIYRDRYGDWTFPKGKLEPNETLEECALREVFEETGLTCTVEACLGQTNYLDRSSRPKEVTYFLMREKDPHNPNPQPRPIARFEVSKTRWVKPEEAMEMLSYERDKELLKNLKELLKSTN